jgi:hypothetical protein
LLLLVLSPRLSRLANTTPSRHISHTATHVTELQVSSWHLPWTQSEILLFCYISEPKSYFKIKFTAHCLQNKKQTPWPLVRERTIPTVRPPLDEI